MDCLPVLELLLPRLQIGIEKVNCDRNVKHHVHRLYALSVGWNGEKEACVFIFVAKFPGLVKGRACTNAAGDKRPQEKKPEHKSLKRDLAV